jgi:hypothetical protein
MIAKGDVMIGLEWRFGPNWPGQRCGAKTRSGSPCKRPANKQKGRCRLHEGASSSSMASEGDLTAPDLILQHFYENVLLSKKLLFQKYWKL